MTLELSQHLDKLDYRKALLAYLLSQDLSYEQAKELSPELRQLSRSALHRYKEAAKIKSWISTRFAEERFGEEVLDELREDAHHKPWCQLEDDLRRLSGGVLKGVWVFYSSEKATPESQTEWDWQLGNFARNSSWLIQKLLLNSKSGIGLGWGKTIANVIFAAAERMKLDKEIKTHGRRKLTIIPTVGTPPDTASDELEKSSTRLAATLSETLNGTGKNVPSLENIWPVVPAELNGEQKKGFLKANLLVGNYKTIFGDGSEAEKPLIKVVDTILTSAGAFHVDTYYMKELVERGRVSKNELVDLALGDIGGVLIPLEDTERDPRRRDRLNRIIDLWTGPQLTDYQETAQRSATSDDLNAPAGVILAALNGNKAKIVLRLVRLRAVSMLIIDYQLANSLKALLDKMKKSNLNSC